MLWHIRPGQNILASDKVAKLVKDTTWREKLILVNLPLFSLALRWNVLISKIPSNSRKLLFSKVLLKVTRKKSVYPFTLVRFYCVVHVSVVTDWLIPTFYALPMSLIHGLKTTLSRAVVNNSSSKGFCGFYKVTFRILYSTTLQKIGTSKVNVVIPSLKYWELYWKLIENQSINWEKLVQALMRD